MMLEHDIAVLAGVDLRACAWNCVAAGAAPRAGGVLAGAENEVPALPQALNNEIEEIARVGSAAKIRALQQAERHLIGCLLRDPGLFGLALADGRGVDEAITPAELWSEPARRLYQRLYERLADAHAPDGAARAGEGSPGEGGPVRLTLAGLLADLASAGQSDLAALATACEAEVEARTEAAPELLPQLFCAQVEAILSCHRELDYQRTRRWLMDAAADSPAGQADAQGEHARLLQQKLLTQRTNSPLRIARIGP